MRATVPYLPRERVDKDGPGWARVVDIAVDQRGDVWLAHGRGGVEERPALSVLRVATGKWDHVAAVGPGSGEDSPHPHHATRSGWAPVLARSLHASLQHVLVAALHDAAADG